MFIQVQGQTCSKLILDLNKRSFPPALTLNSLYVGLSRVRSSTCLRLLPLQFGQKDFGHLLSLQLPKSLLTWKKGFDPKTGYWSREIAMAAASKDTTSKNNNQSRSNKKS